MIELELAGERVRLPELHCYHKSPHTPHRMGAVLAADEHFGKTWCVSETACSPGDIFEMEIPA
jgi:hypothetical protein